MPAFSALALKICYAITVEMWKNLSSGSSFCRWANSPSMMASVGETR
jgi:hypothetical protein